MKAKAKSEAASDSKVDSYFLRASAWTSELSALRKILLACPLREELKWGKPCYTCDEGNVVLLIAFREYCALLFTRGALLQDPQGVLVAAGENSQAARQLRFTSIAQVRAGKALIQTYVCEAIELHKQGRKVALRKPNDFTLPDELQSKFDEMPKLQQAFEALTPGRQRAYVLHFSGAKQSQTRTARIEKCVARILAGKGMNDS